MSLKQYFSFVATRSARKSGYEIITETNDTREDSESDHDPQPGPSNATSSSESDHDLQPGPSNATSSSSKSPKHSKKTASKKRTSKKRKEKFQAWQEEFSWLTIRTGKMFCKVCMDAEKRKVKQPSLPLAAVKQKETSVDVGGKQGKVKRCDKKAFSILGCTNYQHWSLLRHAGSTGHKQNMKTLDRKKDMVQVRRNVDLAATDSMAAQMETAIFLAQELIPDSKFLPILGLQKRHGVTALQNEGSWYTGHTAVTEFHAAAAKATNDRIIKRLNDSQFIGMMLDESLDIAIQKKLVIYFKFVEDGVPQIQFGGNVEVINGKARTIIAAARQLLAKLKVPLGKVMGLGTDGASVMTGCHNGFTTVFKRLNPATISVWCCAHRLSLVCHWAGQAVDALKTIQETLIHIWKYFKYSACRNNHLKNLKGLMNEKVRRFKKPTAVRWLSLDDAVIAAQESWGCLVLSLENTVAEGGDTASAESLLKEVKTYRFISLLCVLRDVLQPLMKCSKYFQKDILDVEETSQMLHNTLDSITALPEHPGVHLTQLHTTLAAKRPYQGIRFSVSDFKKRDTKSVATRFVAAVKEKALERFPETDMALLKSMNKLLNPKYLPVGVHAMADYGDNLLTDMEEAFPQINSVRMREDHRDFKFFLNNNRHLTLQQTCTKIIQQGQAMFPDFVTLANISLCVPLTSVPCERAFSAQNNVHSSKRNRLTVDHLNDKLLILSEKKRENLTAEALAVYNISKRSKPMH